MNFTKKVFDCSTTVGLETIFQECQNRKQWKTIFHLFPEFCANTIGCQNEVLWTAPLLHFITEVSASRSKRTIRYTLGACNVEGISMRAFQRWRCVPTRWHHSRVQQRGVETQLPKIICLPLWQRILLICLTQHVVATSTCSSNVICQWNKQWTGLGYT